MCTNDDLAKGISMEQVKVIFKECAAGWIPFTVSAGSQSVNCRGSELWDPFPHMVAWLESMAGGAEVCSFKMDEEGMEKKFKAFACENKTVRLIIEDAIRNIVLLEAVVDTRQCVSEFYKNLRAFAESKAYVPAQWEDESLSERIQKQSGQTEEELMQECCEKSAEELKEYFFNAAPTYEVISLDAKTPEEKISQFYDYTLHPGKIEHSERIIEIPSYFEFSEEFDYWLVDRRREFIADCLNDRVSSYGGCHLRTLVSEKLERWLAC